MRSKRYNAVGPEVAITGVIMEIRERPRCRKVIQEWLLKGVTLAEMVNGRFEYKGEPVNFSAGLKTQARKMLQEREGA
ncbi:hypothetical protein ACFL2T_00360 [Elusimicrobiota bacterium]